MTVYAFELLYFIKHIGILIHCNFFVALETGHILVSSVELKGSFIMIKSSNFPVVGTMTS
jgi:hypothetical protein